MTKDVCRDEMSKFAALSGCTYNGEICFVGNEFVIQPAISLRQSPLCLRERSAVDKDMYTRFNLWL